MLFKAVIVFIILSISGFELQGQSVQFYHMSVEDALDLAKRQKKKVFIDTYAPWCIPCKRMDKIFRDRELADFFNKHFINVKINMDEPVGKSLYSKYQVIFLPTLLILDPNGYVLHRAERELSIGELLLIGQLAEDPSLYDSSQTIDLAKEEVNIPVDPVEKLVEEKPLPKYDPAEILITQEPQIETIKAEPSQEKILYRLDGSDQAIQPEFLYQEAYFRLQLMDGSHRKTVTNYLATQSDWSTPKNMQFIFDFLYSTDTKEFEFLITHRAKFEQFIGKRKLNESLEILIYNRLYNGFPRPDLKEAQSLYGHIDPELAHIRAHQYILQRLYQDEKYDEYLVFAENYLDNLNPGDDMVIHYLVRIRASKAESKQDVRLLIDRMEQILELHPDNFHYYFTLAELYFINRDKSNAEQAATIAMRLALEKKANTDGIQALLQKIQNL